MVEEYTAGWFELPLIFCHFESEAHSLLINFPIYLKLTRT